MGFDRRSGLCHEVRRKTWLRPPHGQKFPVPNPQTVPAGVPGPDGCAFQDLSINPADASPCP